MDRVYSRFLHKILNIIYSNHAISIKHYTIYYLKLPISQAHLKSPLG